MDRVPRQLGFYKLDGPPQPKLVAQSIIVPYINSQLCHKQMVLGNV